MLHSSAAAGNSYIPPPTMLAVMTDVFVEFAIDPRQGPAPLITTFTDLSHGDIEWWKFDFGDGYELTDRHSVFTHIYTAPGEYRPAMQAGRGTLTAGVVKRIQVDAPPVVASFTMWPTSGVSSLEVAFTDTSAGHPKVWAWDFGDGAASTEQHPTHLYTQPGVYYPTLIAANEYGSDEIRSPSPVVVEEYVEPDPPARTPRPQSPSRGIGARCCWWAWVWAATCSIVLHREVPRGRDV